jgi:probable DNA metabolism protein
MICYTYDGSFEGLLTCIYESYYRKEKPEKILKKDEFIPNLLDEEIYIKTNIDKFSKVYNAINLKISPISLKYIFYVYLSEVSGSSSLIYNYVRLGFKLGKNTDLYLHDKRVLEVHKVVKKVTNEIHRMLGFVRFKSIDNKFLYSAIEPDHNILALITPHFAERLPCENFIIHDLKRELAAVHNGQEWSITALSRNHGLKLLKETQDEIYESLWREYFRSTAIKSRLNPKLQKMHMPKRYWKFLTEIS